VLSNRALLMLVAYCNIGFLVLQRELGTALLLYITFLVVSMFLQGFKNVFVKFRFYSSRCNFGVF